MKSETTQEPAVRREVFALRSVAAKNARRRQLVEAGEFSQRLSIVDAKKGNTTHIDLTPPAASLPD